MDVHLIGTLAPRQGWPATAATETTLTTEAIDTRTLPAAVTQGPVSDERPHLVVDDLHLDGGADGGRALEDDGAGDRHEVEDRGGLRSSRRRSTSSTRAGADERLGARAVLGNRRRAGDVDRHRWHPPSGPTSSARAMPSPAVTVIGRSSVTARIVILPHLPAAPVTYALVTRLAPLSVFGSRNVWPLSSFQANAPASVSPPIAVLKITGRRRRR